MKKVTIFSTPVCKYCILAKEYFAANNIPYEEHDVASDTTRRSEMIEKSGQMGVPVIIIGDNDVVIGFNKPLIAELLDLKS